MRFVKLLTAMVAVFTAVTLGLTMAPAQAVARHDIRNFSAGGTGTDGVFYAKGLAYTAKGQRIYLQAKAKGSSTWRTKKSTTSDPGTGRFVFRFSGSCGSAWRIFIQGDAQQVSTAWFNYGYPDGKLHSYFGKITCS